MLLGCESFVSAFICQGVLEVPLAQSIPLPGSLILQVQKKIQEEMDQKIGLARHPHLSDRPLLPYLEATISEVLRIRPVSPLLIPHVSLADTR